MSAREPHPRPLSARGRGLPRVRTGRAEPARGLSLVELMIGLVIALMIGVVATGSAIMFLGAQRQSVAATGSVTNANAALAGVKNELAAAGLGFYGDTKYRCNTLNLSAGATAHWNNAAFVPLRVTRASGQDMVDVLQASRVEAGAGALLSAATAGADAYLKSYLPAVVGDAVLLSPATTTDPCLVRTVSTVTAATEDTPQRLQFAAAGLHNGAAFATNPTYSAEGGSVTLLGSMRWQRYRLNGTDFVLEQPLTGSSATIARQVIALRVQYGVTSGAVGATSLSSWEAATGTYASLTPTLLPRVRAVRIGIVVRSPQREKPKSDGSCEASSAKPVLFGETIEPDVTDWTCWRFRSAVAVVPLRNLMLGSGT